MTVLVDIELTDQCLDWACIKHIYDTSVHYFMKDQTIMTTIMEDFDYLWVTECISENFLTELKCLHIGVVEDTMDIN